MKKNIVKKINILIRKVSYLILIMNVVFTKHIYADTFDNVTGFVAGWVARIGGLVAFIGAIQFVMALQQEDAGAKRRGILEFSGGVMVVALALGYKSIFGL